MQRLILVASPFQYLCALEFIHAQQDLTPGEQHLVLMGEMEPHSVEQVRALAQGSPVTRLLRTGDQIRGTLAERIGAYADLLPQLAASYDETLIGDLRLPWIQDLACAIPTGRLVMVDDGAATLPIYDFILKDSDWRLPLYLGDPDHPRRAEADAIKASLGLAPRTLDLELFTLFDLPGGRGGHNRFARLRAAHPLPERVGAAWHFLGSPLAEKGLMGPEEYLSVLTDAARRAPAGATAVYFPHRAENMADKAADLAALGYRVHPSDRPYELWLLEQDELPLEITGFASTTHFNIGVIFGDRIARNFYEASAYHDPTLGEVRFMQTKYSVRESFDSIYRRLPDYGVTRRPSPYLAATTTNA